MQRYQRGALCLAALLLCLGSRADAAEDITTWIRKCGGLVSPLFLIVKAWLIC